LHTRNAQQTVQFGGQTPERLYSAFLSSAEHSAMTLDGAQRSTYFRPGVGPVEYGEAGDELRAFAMTGPDGSPLYRLTAKILTLIPIVHCDVVEEPCMEGRAESDRCYGQDSTVTLTFNKNAAGAEIQLVQVNVPTTPSTCPTPARPDR